MMRIIISIFAIVLLVSCDSSQCFVLEGTIVDANDGEMICLSYPRKRDGIWYKQCDTTYVNGGHFRFDGRVDGLLPAELSFQNMDFAELFIEPAEITFSAERSALYDYSILGLSIDNELNKYRKTFSEYDKSVYRKNFEAMRKNEEWVAANNIGSTNANELWAEFYKLILEHHTISDKWPDMAVSYIESHSDQVIIPYLIDKLIRFNYDITAIESHISALTEKQQSSSLGELMRNRYNIAKLYGGKIGGEALDFALRSADGRHVKLSECYAKGYVLLDFWASWCIPCINEIPKVQKLHEEYGDKLQILSISIDKDATDWCNAIEKLHLTDWPQLIIDNPDNAENYYFAEQVDMSLAYGIEQIPCFVLIDKNGVILGRWSHITPTTLEAVERIIIGDSREVQSVDCYYFP